MSISCAVDAERLHQPRGVGLGAVAGGEARHGEGEDVGARQAEPVHRLGRDDQRMGGIEPARHADDDCFDAGGLQPLLRPGDLDVVGLVAVLRRAVPVVDGTNGNRSIGPLEAHVSRQAARAGTISARSCSAQPCGRVEGSGRQPLLAKEIEIDIRYGDLPRREQSASPSASSAAFS